MGHASNWLCTWGGWGAEVTKRNTAGRGREGKPPRSLGVVWEGREEGEEGGKAADLSTQATLEVKRQAAPPPLGCGTSGRAAACGRRQSAARMQRTHSGAPSRRGAAPRWRAHPCTQRTGCCRPPVPSPACRSAQTRVARKTAAALAGAAPEPRPSAAAHQAGPGQQRPEGGTRSSLQKWAEVNKGMGSAHIVHLPLTQALPRAGRDSTRGCARLVWVMRQRDLPARVLQHCA